MGSACAPRIATSSAGHLMVEDRAREKREHLDRGERKECQHGLVVVAQEANGSHESPVAASQQKLQRSQHTSTTAGGCSQTSGVACREGHPDGLIRLPALPGCEWPGALCAARADLTDQTVHHRFANVISQEQCRDDTTPVGCRSWCRICCICGTPVWLLQRRPVREIARLSSGSARHVQRHGPMYSVEVDAE